MTSTFDALVILAILASLAKTINSALDFVRLNFEDLRKDISAMLPRYSEGMGDGGGFLDTLCDE